MDIIENWVLWSGGRCQSIITEPAMPGTVTEVSPDPRGSKCSHQPRAPFPASIRCSFL